MVKCVVKLKKLSDWNKNWCGSRYGPHDYDSGDKKIKQNVVKKNLGGIGTKIGVVVDMDPVIMIVVTKRQKDTKTKIQKGKKK